MSIAGYLKRTSTRGSYSYRRRVPKALKALWGKDEEKQSLKTKFHPEALRLAAMVNTQFEDKAARLRLLLAGKTLPAEELMAQAKDILMTKGIHPQQIPRTKAETDKFFQKQEDFKELFIGVVDTEEVQEPDGTTWTNYIEDKTNPYQQAFNMLHGEGVVSMVPTIAEAADTYIRVNATKKNRSPNNQKKHEQRIWRAIVALGKQDTPITDFNRLRARRHKGTLVALNPTWKADTLNKTLGMLTAVFTTTIREYELAMPNPWAGLKDDVSFVDDKAKRRSFTPDEQTMYLDSLDKVNDEVRLIGLLMVHTGCRLMEAGGLMFGDLKLSSNIPHINLRYNNIRSLKNKNSIRDVPLVDKALDQLRAYLSKREEGSPKAPVFPRYGRDGGTDAASQILNNVIRKRLKIDDPALVAYSARHTMKDKLRALRTAERIQHGILGHGKRTDADAYGDGEPLSYLLDELVKAGELNQWGAQG